MRDQVHAAASETSSLDTRIRLRIYEVAKGKNCVLESPPPRTTITDSGPGSGESGKVYDTA